MSTSIRRPNPAQEKVISHTHPGNVLVNAGAGTGKTRTLTFRFEQALRDNPEMSPGNILAITYTNAAAEELRARVQGQLRERAIHPDTLPEDAELLLRHARAMDQAWISTFHSFCARVIRSHAFDLGIDPNFVQLDGDETDNLRAEVLDRFATAINQQAGKAEAIPLGIGQFIGFTDPQVNEAVRALTDGMLYAFLVKAGWSNMNIEKRLDDMLDTCAKHGRGTDDLESQPWEYAIDDTHRSSILIAKVAIELARRFSKEYTNEKLQRGVMDYEDLISYTRALFDQFPHAVKRYKKRFSHIMVDEFQDTNRVLYDIIGRIAEDNLCLVGDVKQSIFGFNGADVTLISDLDKEWEKDPDNEVVPLSINYRSSKEIVEYVNMFCGHESILGNSMEPIDVGKTKEYAHKNSLTGPRVSMIGIEAGGNNGTVEAEATIIAEQLRDLHDQGVPLKDMAIIVDQNSVADSALKALERIGLHGSIEGGKSFYQEPSVGEFLALLKLVRNPHDDQSFAEVALSAAGNLTDETLASLGRLKALSKKSGAKKKCSLYDAAQSLSQEDPNLRHLLDVLEQAQSMVGSYSANDILTAVYRDRGVFDLWASMKTKAERDQANFHKFQRIAEAFHIDNTSLADFIATIEQARDNRRKEKLGQWMTKERESITILTVHGAKGREFPIVAYLGGWLKPYSIPKEFAFFNDDSRTAREFIEQTIPSVKPKLQQAAQEQWARQSPNAVVFVVSQDGLLQERNALYSLFRHARFEQEFSEIKRLFYVAVTRAEEQLLVTYRMPKNPPAGHDKRNLGHTLGVICKEMEGKQGVFDIAFDSKDEFEARRAETDTEIDRETTGEKPAMNLYAPRETPVYEQTHELVQVSASQIRTFSQCPWQYWWVYGNRLNVNRNTVVMKNDEDIGETATASLRGTATHKLLEVMPPFDRVKAETIMQALGIPTTEFEDIWSSVEKYRKSDLYRDLELYEIISKEHQFYLALDQYYLYGFMDVYARDAEQNALIVDYKISDSDVDKSESYEKQEHLYALVALEQGAKTAQVVFAQIKEDETLDNRETARVYTREDIVELRDEILTDIKQMQKTQTGPPADPPRALCTFCPVPKALCEYSK